MINQVIAFQESHEAALSTVTAFVVVGSVLATTMRGDSEQDYFAHGITEDLLTALQVFRTFPGIARNSTLAYKGTSPDVRDVARDFGAGYVIEDSVRKSGNKVRITAQLVDAEGRHV